MVAKTIFFDTYAFFELIMGNPKYALYKEDVAIITSHHNLIELHYGLLQKYGVEEADSYYSMFEDFVLPIGPLTVKLANEFKAKHRGVSYADAIGYTMANWHRVPFLTGDEAFKNLDNVIFIK